MGSVNLCVETVLNLVACGFAIMAFFFNNWVTYKTRVYDLHVGLAQINYLSNDPDTIDSYTVNNWCASADNIQDGLSRKDSLIQKAVDDDELLANYTSEEYSYCSLTNRLTGFIWCGVGTLLVSLLFSLITMKCQKLGDSICRKIVLIFTYAFGFFFFALATAYGTVLAAQFCDLSDPEVCYSAFSEYFIGVATILAGICTIQQLFAFFAVSLAACFSCLRENEKPQTSGAKPVPTTSTTGQVQNQSEGQIAMVNSQV